MMNKPTNNIYDLRLRLIIASFRAESAALWFLCFYIFMEYIRPQGMYPVIDILPWGEVAILGAVVSVFITRSKALGFGAMDKLFIAFTITVFFSIIFAWNIDASLKHWTTYVSWILMYFCIVKVLTTPNRLLLFAIFFMLINFKLSEHGARTFAMRGFSFARWGLAGSPGWFHNSGEFALQMVVTFSMSLALLLAFREQIEKRIRWWILLFLFPGTAMLSVIGSSSRGGQIALIVVILMLALKGRHIIRRVIILGVLISLTLYILPDKQMARFHTAGEDRTSELRLTYWKYAIDVIKNHPLGIGYKNWMLYYAYKYQPDKVEQIHNTVLEAFVDLGFPGGILFLIMIITAIVMNTRTASEMRGLGSVENRATAAIATGINLGLVGTFIAAQFMSVLFYPMFWLAFALTSALRHFSRKKMLEHNKLLTKSGFVANNNCLAGPISVIKK